MTDQFVAEIRIFPFYFPPSGWAQCNGQLIPISQNTALFALLGTYYGGDGKSTFALPNMQDSTPVHAGQGSGLSIRGLGEQGGSSCVTLIQSEIPVHRHAQVASNGETDEEGQKSPQDAAPGKMANAARLYAPMAPPVAMSPTEVAPAGGSLPHNNMMPTLTMNFCIAMQGIFPPRP